MASNQRNRFFGIYRRLAYKEAGEGEVYLFTIVLIGCLLLSGSVALLRWIKATKDARAQSRDKKIVEPLRRELPGYQITYLPGLCGKNPCSSEIGD